MMRRYAIAILLGLSASTTMTGGSSPVMASPQGSSARSRGSQTVAGQTRTLLRDGRWLTIGGEGAENRATLWNPATNVAVSISLPTPRAWHTATILSDGTVLVAGGRDGGEFVTTLEVFDAA